MATRVPKKSKSKAKAPAAPRPPARKKVSGAIEIQRGATTPHPEHANAVNVGR